MLFAALGAFWAGTAFTYSGREVFWHLFIGAGYVAFSVPTFLASRRTLRAAARVGIHPRRRLTRARRSTPRRRP